MRSALLKAIAPQVVSHSILFFVYVLILIQPTTSHAYLPARAIRLGYEVVDPSNARVANMGDAPAEGIQI